MAGSSKAIGARAAMLFAVMVGYNAAMSTNSPTDLESFIRAACVLEATARKPGNVHPQAAFSDLTYSDFLTAADIVAPRLARASEVGVGRAVLDSVSETQRALGRNVNLGIVLLLAPLSAVPRETPLQVGIGQVLSSITQQETELVYQAIRLANPGGMGSVEDQDISQPPTQSLLEAMKLAAARDQIAAEYTTNFATVLREARLFSSMGKDFVSAWENNIVLLQLKLLSQQGDSLIARKCGEEVSLEAQRGAQRVLNAHGRSPQEYSSELAQYDNWLRSNGHRHNPGTTADLIAAILFAAMRDDLIEIPCQDIRERTSIQIAEGLLATAESR